MIITQLNGGLGNQLFQYALGKAIATNNNCKLYLDLTKLESNGIQTKRHYSLDKLRVKGIVLSSTKILFIKILSKLKIKSQYNYVEKSNNYDKYVVKLGKDVNIWGYWQCYKYFDDIRDTLIREYQPKNEIVFDKAIAKAIYDPNSVSIHIRRGDYVTNAAAKTLLGVLPLSYYIKSIESVYSKVPKPKFIVVSEDLKWARQNLDKYLPKNTFYFHKDEISDFELLKNTRHSIIANSSYSWWAAYLGNKAIVIAPKRWYTSGKMSTRDLIPKKWIQI